MLRKTMMALLATASLALVIPGTAFARPGGGHGSFGGHGMSMGGMRGGSFNAAGIGGGTGFRSAAVTPHVGGNPGFVGNHGGHDWHGHDWHGRGYGGIGAGLALGGLYGAYAYYGGPYDDGYYDNSYYDGSYYDPDDSGGCYIVRQRVHTAYGWRIRPVQVCG